MREDCQRLGEIHVLHDHVVGNGKLHGGEVPYALHARRDKRRRALLGGGVWHREDAKLNVQPMHETVYVLSVMGRTFTPWTVCP